MIDGWSVIDMAGCTGCGNAAVVKMCRLPRDSQVAAVAFVFGGHMTTGHALGFLTIVATGAGAGQ